MAYAHNGGKFDFHFLTDEIETDQALKIIHGRLASFRIGECEFRDSFSILPIPLAGYKKDEINYAIFEEGERDKPKNREKISAYLRSDCIYLYELIAAFKEKYGHGLTLAGSALSFWSKNFGVDRPKSSRHFFEEIRPYYFGGRCEAIAPGEHQGKFKLYDINSAYPRAMREFHAWGERYTVTKKLPPKKEIAQSFITLTCAAFGAFPKRAPSGELTFPATGERMTFNITGWEYIAALETGTLGPHDVERVVTFPDHMNFAGYVDQFYEMKKKSPKGSPDYIFAKLFMNSLYGKFAADPSKYRDYLTIHPDEIAIHLKEGWKFTSLLGRVAVVEKSVPEQYQRYYNVATGASITGYVRAMLWRAICSAKRPIYVDTDSIACESAKIELGPELGQWSQEFSFDRAAIGGKKLYAFWDTKTKKEKLAHKGVKLSRIEIIRIAKGETIEYTRDTPSFSIKPKANPFLSRKVRRTDKGGK